MRHNFWNYTRYFVFSVIGGFTYVPEHQINFKIIGYILNSREIYFSKKQHLMEGLEWDICLKCNPILREFVIISYLYRSNQSQHIIMLKIRKNNTGFSENVSLKIGSKAIHYTTILNLAPNSLPYYNFPFRNY